MAAISSIIFSLLDVYIRAALLADWVASPVQDSPLLTLSSIFFAFTAETTH
jgi:hypothetical protein